VSTLDTNIRGTWAVLEAARRSPLVRQVVVASSDKAYGSHDTLPYTEEMPLIGRHPYDVSKSCADLISQSYARTYELPVVVVRCGNLFGGGDLNWNRLIPGTIRSTLLGERTRVRSDGESLRDYLYVEDAVLAYMRVAEALADRRELRGEAFNFGHNLPLPVKEVVGRILALCGRTDLPPDVRAEARHEIPHQYLDSSKARRVLQWEPAFPLDEGLRRTIAWYRDFLNDGQ
jgi:CDP-glucose 4,6-dehydratase